MNDAARFVGRAWVFQAIDDWLRDAGAPRFLLLTGSPGSGKTAIAEELQRRFLDAQGVGAPAPHRAALRAAHFCTARRSASIDALSFVRSLSLQLAVAVPSFARALKSVGEVPVHLEVTQVVGSAERVTAVHIDNLDLSGLSARRAFVSALINPLRKMNTEADRPPLLALLVDGLDESITSDEPTITDLLASAEDIPAWVRILATSRPLERIFRDLPNHQRVSLSSPQVDALNQADLAEYVRVRIDEIPSGDSSKSAAAVQRVADGNFLYARLLLDDLTAGRVALDALEGLPSGLDAYFYASIKRAAGDSWSVSGRIWSVLLAAREPLSQRQIESVLGAAASDVEQFIESFEPFLEQTDAREREYSLFHQSLRDFFASRDLVLSSHRLRNPYHLDPRAGHAALSEHYAGVSGSSATDWSRIDDYGLRHLPLHMLDAGRERHLIELLSSGFLPNKVERFHDYRSIREDLLKGLAAAERSGDFAAILRFGLAIDWLRARVGADIAQDLAPLYALAGEVERAVDLAEMAAMDWERAVALRNIVAIIAPEVPDEARSVADRQVSAEGRGESLLLLLKAQLLRDSDVQRHDQLVREIVAFAELSSDRTWQSLIFRELFIVLGPFVSERAQEMFSKSLEWARADQDAQQRCLSLWRLCRTGVRLQDTVLVELLNESLDALEQMSQSGWRAATFGRIVADLASLDTGHALARARKAKDEHCRFNGLIAVAPIVAVGDVAAAKALLVEAEERFAAIGLGKSERVGWQDKARQAAAAAAQQVALVASGAQPPPALQVEESPLSLRIPDPRDVAMAASLLGELRASIENPPEDPIFTNLIFACVRAGRRGDAVRLVQSRILEASRTHYRGEWRTSLQATLIGAVAEHDPGRALELAGSLAHGRGRAIGEVVETLARTDVAEAMDLLESTDRDDDWDRTDCLAQLLISAARMRDVPRLAHALYWLLEECGATELSRARSLEDVERLLDHLRETRPVLSGWDVLCDAFSVVSGCMASYSLSTARAFFRVAIDGLYGDPRRIAGAIAEIGAFDPALAVAFAAEAREAYDVGMMRSETSKYEGISEVAAALAPFALEDSLRMLEQSVRMPQFRAAGYSALARAHSGSDRALAREYLSRARSEAAFEAFDWMRIEALLRIAADCVHWSPSDVPALLDGAIAAARSPASGRTTLAETLARAAQLRLRLGEEERAVALLDEAANQMRDQSADVLEVDAIVNASQSASPELACRVAVRLVQALVERDSWGPGTPVLDLSHQVAALLIHANGEDHARRAASAEQLLAAILEAEDLAERVFIG